MTLVGMAVLRAATLGEDYYREWDPLRRRRRENSFGITFWPLKFSFLFYLREQNSLGIR